MGEENRGGLPDLDQKSRSGFFLRHRGYPDSPQLKAKNRGELGLASIYQNYLEILKSRGGLPDPDLSKNRGGLPDPDPDPSRPDFGRDFIPLDISRPWLFSTTTKNENILH